MEVPKSFEPDLSGNNYVADDASKKMKHGMSVKETGFVSMEKNKIRTAKSRQVAILLEDGYDYSEVMQVKQALMAAGAHAKIVSKFYGMRTSSTGEEMETDKSHITTGSIMYDAIYIPDGEKHIEALRKEGDVLHFKNEAFKHGKAIATSGNGISLFQKSDVLGADFADATSSDVITSKGVVTAGNDADAKEFVVHFIEAIKEHRHWDREEKMMVPA